MLKDAAINWVRANCSDPKLRADFSRKITDVLQRRVDCWIAVGQALTRGRVPYMIHCFAGELFIFQISKAQAAGLMLAPDAMASSSDPRPAPPQRNPFQLVMSISNLHLDEAVLTAADRITGSFTYEIEGEKRQQLVACGWIVRWDCLAMKPVGASRTSPSPRRVRFIFRLNR